MSTACEFNSSIQSLKENDPALNWCKHLLREVGEDPSREGLLRTPERFKKAFLELTSGYGWTAEEVVGEGIFASESNGPIVVNDISFFSLCEHHLLPFYGTVSIGYLPDQNILGLSKLARIVEVYARRLQVQERLTREIADSVHTLVSARGVMVQIKATHLCMTMRGVQKPGAETATSYQVGFQNVSAEEKAALNQHLGGK